ncbi:DUF5703 family protein [Nonomuraea rubra]
MDIFIPRDISLARAARQLLTEHAEYGKWELARVRAAPRRQPSVRLRR